MTQLDGVSSLNSYLTIPKSWLIWFGKFHPGGDFNPSEKYAQVKLDHFPEDWGENKKCLKPPASLLLFLQNFKDYSPLGTKNHLPGNWIQKWPLCPYINGPLPKIRVKIRNVWKHQLPHDFRKQPTVDFLSLLSSLCHGHEKGVVCKMMLKYTPED